MYLSFKINSDLYRILLLLVLIHSVSGTAAYCQDIKSVETLPAHIENSTKSQLLTKNFPGDNWTFFSGKKDSKISDTWTYIEDKEAGTPYIICSGQPYGYIRTKKKFQNFEFGLEWRFPNDQNGNSGVLVYTTGDDRIWPTSLQIQLQQPFAGSVFPSGGAKSSNELRNVPMLSRPINQWNRCVIHSLNGTVTVTINDQKVGSVADCEPMQGAISLQSEGSEVHFRNVWIRVFPNDKKSVQKTSSRRQRRLGQNFLKQFNFREITRYIK